MRLPQVGETFVGRYVLDAILGEGGFATVYDAHDEIGRRVAIKILKQDDSSAEASAEAAARFEREVMMLSRLTDPCTVRLFDFGTDPRGLRYMVFEHVPGRDLRELMQRVGTLDDQIVRRIMSQVLRSLREAHQQGLLHRDLKPENIRVYSFMGDPWTTKLLDFGIARPLHGSAQPTITRAGELIGTPRYMSPEQLTDKQLTPASDLYSLGLVMLEARYGGEMLMGDSWGAQIQRLVDDFQFLDIRTARGLDHVLARMTARDVRDRFRSAEEVLAALDAPTSSYAQYERPPDRTVDRTIDRLPVQQQTRWWLAIPAGVLAVAILAGLLVHKSRQRQPVVVQRDVTDSSALLRRAIATPESSKPKASTTTPKPTVDPSGLVGAEGCAAPPKFRGRGKLELDEGLTVVSQPIFVPESYDHTKQSPLIVMFHDNLQTPLEFLEQSEMEATAEKLGAVLLIPGGAGPFPWSRPDSVRDIEYWVLAMSDNYCIDEGSVFIVGSGFGGTGVELLSCEDWVKGIVAVSFRADSPPFKCARTSAPPVPYLEINATRGRRMPVEGGNSCANTPKLSLADAEERWIKRNHCAGEAREYRTEDEGVCFEWTCDTPFRSCHTDGGHGWPGPRAKEFPAFDPNGCDPVAANFPTADVIAEFLDSLTKHGSNEAP